MGYWLLFLKIDMLQELELEVKLGLGVSGNNQGFGFIQIVRERGEDKCVIQDS